MSKREPKNFRGCNVNKIVLALCLFLSACGTTTSLHKMQPDGVSKRISLENYNVLIVKPFTDGIEDNHSEDLIEDVGRLFSKQLTSQLQKSNEFRRVKWNKPCEEGAAIISGKITQYEDGSKLTRFIVGFGMGNSRFDANVQVHNCNGQNLGQVIADKTSWFLGGYWGMSQNIDDVQRLAAAAIADEIVNAKKRETDDR